MVIYYYCDLSHTQTTQLLHLCRTLQTHPHAQLVPILDSCLLPAGQLRIVCATVNGTTLQHQLTSKRPNARESAELLIPIAQALQHMHKLGLAHRSLCPENILIEPDSSGTFLNCLPLTPTSAYYSPEQAAGELHRVDHRSDLFTLSVILYELLTSVRPFAGRTHKLLLQQIAQADAIPPRNVQPSVPIGLQQICLDNLQRRRTDRCLSAGAFAAKLQHWLQDPSAASAPSPQIPSLKLLSPFAVDDFAEFPELIDGPRDVHGLPVILTRLITGLETTHVEQTFATGVLSGPAGAGKTSFLQAGVLPRLPASITTVHVDAAKGHSERQLLTALQIACPELNFADHADSPDFFPELLHEIRQTSGPKILLVIDHFEHWLQHTDDYACTPLAIALRHCDGSRLQTLLVATDTALISTTRFMSVLDIDLVPDFNYFRLETLSRQQATTLLTHFGRSHGKLEQRGQLTSAEQNFIEQVLKNMLQEGRVPQWKLAPFLQHSLSLTWQPTSVQDFKTADHVMVQLLQNAFDGLPVTSQKVDSNVTARRLLQSLLPDPAAPQRRITRTTAELIQTAGLHVPPDQALLLLQELSSKLNIITQFPSISAQAGPVAAIPPQSASTDPSPTTSTEDTTADTTDDIAVETRSTSSTASAQPSPNHPAPNTAPGAGTETSLTDDLNSTNAVPPEPAVETAASAELTRSEAGVSDITQDVTENTDITVTTSDPANADSTSKSPTVEFAVPQTSWHLTHDFLIPILRAWLTAQQQGTRMGRAELLFDDLLKNWLPQQQHRHLPTLLQWLQIARCTDRTRWSDAHTRMIRAAERFHVRCITLCTIAVVALLYTGTQSLQNFRTRQLAYSLVTAPPAELPELLVKADEAGDSLDPLLLPHLAEKADLRADPSRQPANLAARLALLPRDPKQVAVLTASLLTADLSVLPVIRDRLAANAEAAAAEWQTTLLDTNRTDQRRFQAALGLAGLPGYAAPDRWSQQTLDFVAERLTSSFAEKQPQLRRLLQPIAALLLPHLQQRFSDPQSSTLQQTSAAAALADYAGSNPQLLLDLLLQATPAQAELLIPPFRALKHGPSIERLSRIPAEPMPGAAGTVQPAAIARRNANAVLTLAACNHHSEANEALKLAQDPETLSELQRLCGQWPVSVGDFVLCFEYNERTRVRREVIALQPEESRVAFGMLLALSNWDAEQLPAAVRETLPRHLKRLYQDDPSAAIHGISGWVLRKWGYHKLLDEADAVSIPWDPRSDRQWFRLHIDMPTARTATSSTAARAATTKLSLTFVAFPAGEYTIGTPARTVRITTPFAVCDRELPASVMALCQPQITSLLSNDAEKQASADDLLKDAAASGLSWVDAVSICRSLTARFRGPAESWQCFPALPAQPTPLAPDHFNQLQISHLGFRMPTSDEWEIAARGGFTTDYQCGTDPQYLSLLGWSAPDIDRPKPSGLKRPSLSGLFDCHGNVSEWTIDRPANARTRPEPGDTLNLQTSAAPSRIHRGGSWQDTALQQRLDATSVSPEVGPQQTVGLRLACTLPAPARKSNIESNRTTQ